MPCLFVPLCLLCGKSLKYCVDVVHPLCVPIDQIMTLCNCNSIVHYSAEHLSFAVERYNTILDLQKSEYRLTKACGVLLVINVCQFCAGGVGKHMRIVYIYERLSEAN